MAKKLNVKISQAKKRTAAKKRVAALAKRLNEEISSIKAGTRFELKAIAVKKRQQDLFVRIGPVLTGKIQGFDCEVFIARNNRLTLNVGRSQYEIAVRPLLGLLIADIMDKEQPGEHWRKFARTKPRSKA